MYFLNEDANDEIFLKLDTFYVEHILEATRFKTQLCSENILLRCCNKWFLSDLFK